MILSMILKRLNRITALSFIKAAGKRKRSAGKFVSPIAATVVCLLLAACGDFKPVSNMYDLPYAYPPNAPPDYKAGWEHGCKSGFGSMGNLFIKTFYKFTQDDNMRRNPSYMRAWTDAFDYCRSVVNRLQAGSGRTLKAGESPAIFSNTGLNVRPNYDVRDTTGITKPGLGMGLFDGLDIPGWGGSGWGKNVSCQKDWLWRTPEGCHPGGYGYN